MNIFFITFSMLMHNAGNISIIVNLKQRKKVFEEILFPCYMSCPLSLPMIPLSTLTLASNKGKNTKIHNFKLLIRFEWNFIKENGTPEKWSNKLEEMNHSIGFVCTSETFSLFMIGQLCDKSGLSCEGRKFSKWFWLSTDGCTEYHQDLTFLNKQILMLLA